MTKFIKGLVILGVSGCLVNVVFNDHKEPPKEISISLKIPKMIDSTSNPISTPIYNTDKVIDCKFNEEEKQEIVHNQKPKFRPFQKLFKIFNKKEK